MNCDECRAQMLEAEPKVLAGMGDEPIAAHVRSCEACREIATAILREVQVARSAYLQIVPESVPPLPAVRSGMPRALWAIASVAAAAAIVIAVSAGPGQPEQHLTSRNLEPDTTAASAIAVEVPDGRNAIVFDTKNSKVSVVWIY